MIDAIVKALRHLDHAPAQHRNGPVYQAANELRGALGLGPAEIGGKFSFGVPVDVPHVTSDAVTKRIPFDARETIERWMANFLRGDYDDLTANQLCNHLILNIHASGAQIVNVGEQNER